MIDHKITKFVSAEAQGKYVRVVWNDSDDACEIDCAEFHVNMDARTMELLYDALNHLYTE